MCAAMWHTDSMVEWTEVKVADGVDLRLVASALGIRAIEFDPQPVSEWPRNDGNPLLLEVASQLRAYFAGALREFLLPLDIDRKSTRLNSSH